ncbi:MAG TPA: trimethylamine methyltransferase family protein [Candidatus Blautia gallistercoris]|uniref:Trimethylamine methyltransferase family protein n=1 Tax=Candidatus Blautia gallistercoris TaxID=2838490 RepID=A0A9D2B2M2_9FIRM|nr:trimethylamine methyltransferase family protein [Candidatus Blautia gallistercoris]
MNLAGQVQPLTQDEMQRVHDSACRLLEEKGIVFQSEEAREALKQHGCKVEGETVFMPKTLVEKCWKQCPSTFKLEAMDPKYNVTVGEDILIHPAGGEVFVLDHDGTRRAPTLKDCGELQTLYQYCENVNIGGFQPLSPMDVPERTKGLYLTYNAMQKCSKPILSPMELETIEKKEEVLKLFNLVYGSDNYLDDHYLTWHAVCPNSPYLVSEFVCDGIKVYAEHNQPIIIVSAPMTGITSPIFLISTVILSIAEMLSCLVYAQVVKPGVPVVMSASLTYGNLRYATWECASPDTALMLATSIQMFKHFYHLPARSQTGVTSSKICDYQAGMETMQSFLFSALAGVNLTSQTVSSLAGLLTSSLEKTILDDELISRVRWMVNGMKLDEEQWDLSELLEAEPGQDFLMSDNTLDYMHDYWQPTVSDWRTIEAWEADGCKNVEEVAHEKVVKILAEAPETLLDSEQEKIITDYIRYVEKNA